MDVFSDLSEKDDISVLYNQDYYDGESEGYKGYTFEKLSSGFKVKLASIKKYCNKGRLLDVGCAKGFFVKIALDAGFDAYGVDFSSYAINFAKNLVGYRAAVIDLEKESPPFNIKVFDVITAWDFLEHLKEPENFLCKANSLLEIDGYLFLTTVNYDSLMAHLMRQNWRFKDPLHFCYYVTPELLAGWLKEAGFKVVNMRTFSLNLKPLPEKLKFVERVLSAILTLLNPFISKLSLGDSIFCIAQKEFNLKPNLITPIESNF